MSAMPATMHPSPPKVRREIVSPNKSAPATSVTAKVRELQTGTTKDRGAPDRST